jgi:hypothetical protein
MNEAGDKKVLNNIHNAADIHSYRGDYATAIYLANARPLEQIPKCDRYYCRKDKKGVWYDKEAMKITSKALGHNDTDTTRSYILNNQGKKKSARRIIDALSEMNGSDVLMGTQNSRNEKSPEVF